eukprot:69624-Pleurochrysis_carterae.AAC.1
MSHRPGRMRLWRPAVEPVDGAAVDERGEHAASHTEGRAHRRHGEHDVQVLAHARDEELLDALLGLWHTGVVAVRPHVTHDPFPLVVGKEVGHLARVEYVVDVLDKGLGDNLRVGEEEDDGRAVDARHVVELLEVLAELIVAVPLGQLDLEALHVGDVGGEARERLLSRAADADEHRVAAWLAQHAAQARHVLDRVPEEDEAHLLVLGVVLVQVAVEQLVQLGGVVHQLVPPLLARQSHARVVAEHELVLALKQVGVRP